MGIFDKLKQDADDQGGGVADQGLEKAGQMVDEKTGGKYSDQVDTGVKKAEEYANQQFGQQGTPGDGAGQAQQQPMDPGRQMDPNQQADPNQQMDPNQQTDQSPQNY